MSNSSKTRVMINSLFCTIVAGVSLACAFQANAAGDPKRGAADFRACSACHSVEPGLHLSGPSLARVWGRKAGAVEGFLRYSNALKKSGLVWTEQTLDKWLENPDRLIPGNEMAFPGIKEKKARQDIMAYLKAVSEGKAPSAKSGQGGMMGMMGGGPMPNLKEADAEARVKAIRYCRDTYFVTTAANQTIKFWEFNLRIKTDSGANGPHPGKPVLLGAGMMGDRASVVFAGPAEISPFIRQSCE